MIPVRDIANQILDTNPDPVVRLRLLRDVLRSSPEEIARAKKEASESSWVVQLGKEQRQDGSWGRFHSEDTRLKQKIPTTEFGVARAQALGLDDSHPITRKAVNYLACLLKGEFDFPDPAEKNNRWSTGVRLFTASTLARISPGHPALKDSLELWSAIAERTFSSGEYDPGAEIQAHRQLTGASVENSYLRLHGKYQITLLGSQPNLLARKTETNLLNWLWRREDGLGYLDMPLSPPKPGCTASQMDRWFTSMEIVSRFSGWHERAKEITRWLRDRLGENGLWDFGSKAFRSTFMPLSQNRRGRYTRTFDWTTRTLILLERYNA
ncbi:MAG: hypothetical protein DPW18_04060 [Chloroflexi bacterium]|nr:hypothetical protein [Chloroflexota bacterium]MDL1941191.1 hypothetical protein [Chloroflexi bacterium CFX2]